MAITVKKPQMPIQDGNDNYIYPITDVSQIVNGDSRLNATLDNLQSQINARPTLLEVLDLINDKLNGVQDGTH